jgi:hypothetical protein
MGAESLRLSNTRAAQADARVASDQNAIDQVMNRVPHEMNGGGHGPASGFNCRH